MDEAGDTGHYEDGIEMAITGDTGDRIGWIAETHELFNEAPRVRDQRDRLIAGDRRRRMIRRPSIPAAAWRRAPAAGRPLGDPAANSATLRRVKLLHAAAILLIAAIGVSAFARATARQPSARRELADQRRRGQHPLLAADADQPRATSRQLQVAWTYDSRRRVHGLRDAEQPRRRRRRALRDDADAAGRRARRGDRARSCGGSIPSGGAAAAHAVPASRRHRARRIASSSRYRNFLWALDQKTGTADPVVRRRRPHRSARGARQAGRAAERQRQHAGRRLRGPADPRQQRARDAARHARPHPRVRREDRQAALDLPHHSAARRVRLRHLAAGRRTSCPAAPTRGPGVTVDPKRGMVFAATGSASFDFYGVNRHGDNLFANCVLALDARTGKRVWHFQAIKHDVWDWDFPAAPTSSRSRATAAGRRRRADHEERLRLRARSRDRRRRSSRSSIARCRRPTSTASRLAETQPYPMMPPPFARQGLTEDMLTTRTPEAHAAVLARFRKLEVRRSSTPPSLEGTIVFPGFDGGAEWGGAAFDPETGAALRQLERDAVDRQADPEQRHVALQLASARRCHREDRTGTPAAPSLVGIGKRLYARRDRGDHPRRAPAACRRFPTWARATSTTSSSSWSPARTRAPIRR